MSDPLWPSVLPGARWYPAHRADHRARALYLRHYSRFKRKKGSASPQFVSPGECMVLLTPAADALWVWHRTRPGLRLDGLEGPVCACFRNESPYRASDLILEAQQLAWARWPGQPLYTYVSPAHVRSSNPGYCFKLAGWQRCGTSARGLLLFERRPMKVEG